MLPMTYEPEERAVHMLFGLSFRSTPAEQRSVWLKLCQSPESKRWGPLNQAVRHCHLLAHDPQTRELLGQLEEAECKMTELAARLIDGMELERGFG